MLFDRKTIKQQLNSQSLVIGYDLGEYDCQISYATLAGEEPQTLSTVAGGQQFNIPTVLCKRFEVNQWFYGKEAVKSAEAKEGIRVDHLLSKARRRELVEVEDIQFESRELLTLFLKRSFSLLTMITERHNIAAVMITVDQLDQSLIELLNEAIKTLPVREDQILFQSHEESAFHYMVHQPAELWHHGAAVCDYVGDYLKTYRMELNYNTIPIVALIECQEYPQVQEENDEQLLTSMMQLCEGHILNAVFLIGDCFQGDWCENSLHYLCRQRRVFQGNNLYSKGASYSMREKLLQSEIGRDYVFLGKDKLKSNVGMQVIRDGEETYQVLLDAGENWYDAGKKIDFMLEGGNVIPLQITSLQQGTSKTADFILSGLPMRPKKTTRIHMEIHLQSESILQIKAVDMGFGELFPSSKQEWTEEMALQ